MFEVEGNNPSLNSTTTTESSMDTDSVSSDEYDRFLSDVDKLIDESSDSNVDDNDTDEGSVDL